MIMDWSEFREMALVLSEIGYIPVFEDLTANLEEIVRECILKLRARDIKEAIFLIDSAGGSNCSFASIKGAMLTSGLTFTGIVLGRACSNAFQLLQQCNKRIAVVDSVLIFHWGSQVLDNQQLAALISGDTWPIEHALNIELVTAQSISERTGVSVEQLKDFAWQEREFSAQEALKMNFIDEILQEVPQNVELVLSKNGKHKN